MCIDAHLQMINEFDDQGNMASLRQGEKKYRTENENSFMNLFHYEGTISVNQSAGRAKGLDRP